MAKKKRKQINRNLRRAVIYIRYSSPNQSDGYSIEYQLEQVHAYAEKHGYTIVGEYIDKAKTAKQTAGRNALEEMLNDADKDLYDVIIVFSFNRAFRNTLDALSTHTKLKDEYGILLLSCIEHIDMTNPHGMYAATSLFAMHQLSSEINAEHVKAAMFYAIQQGYYMGGKLPLGYKIVSSGEYIRNKERTRVAIDDRFAPLIREIYDLYNTGIGTNTIAKILSDKGITNDTGKPIRASVIQKILKNQCYTGISKHQFDGYPELLLDNVFPKIIDENTFEKAQIIRKTRVEKKKPRYRTSDHVYYFSGKMFCGICGTRCKTTSCTPRDKSIERHRYYYCPKRAPLAGKQCHNPYLPTKNINNIVMENIHKHILNKQTINQITQNVYKIVKERNVKSDTKALENRKKELLAMLKDLAKQSITKAIPESVLEEISIEYNTELNSIEKALTRTHKENRPINAEDIHKYLTDLAKTKTHDVAGTKAIFDMFVENIIIHPDKIEIKLSLPLGSFKGTEGEGNTLLYEYLIILDI